MVIGHTIAYWNTTHMTMAYALKLVAPFRAAFRAAIAQRSPPRLRRHFVICDRATIGSVSGLFVPDGERSQASIAAVCQSDGRPSSYRRTEQLAGSSVAIASGSSSRSPGEKGRSRWPAIRWARRWRSSPRPIGPLRSSV